MYFAGDILPLYFAGEVSSFSESLYFYLDFRSPVCSIHLHSTKVLTSTSIKAEGPAHPIFLWFSILKPNVMAMWDHQRLRWWYAEKALFRGSTVMMSQYHWKAFIINFWVNSSAASGRRSWWNQVCPCCGWLDCQPYANRCGNQHIRPMPTHTCFGLPFPGLLSLKTNESSCAEAVKVQLKRQPQRTRNGQC